MPHDPFRVAGTTAWLRRVDDDLRTVEIDQALELAREIQPTVLARLPAEVHE